MEEFKKWVKKYLEFGLGTIFGAIIATLTSYSIFAISGGDLNQAEFLQIKECLVEKLNE